MDFPGMAKAQEAQGVGENFYNVETSLTRKSWRERPFANHVAMGLAQKFAVPEIMSRVLAGRGHTMQTTSSFLAPKLRDFLPDPSCLRDMDKAVLRIAKAIYNQEKIAIFADYDVDGATAASLLLRYLRDLGRQAMFYIPHRLQEGYGPNLPAMQHLHEQGADLILTVDCGAGAGEILSEAIAEGVDIVVMDHHPPGACFPEEIIMVNPNHPDCGGKLGELAAVGVVFMTLIGLNRQLRRDGWFAKTDHNEPDLLAFCDLVALGTICDMMPLQDVNRALVVQGLKIMRRGQNLGLRTLAATLGIKAEANTDHLGFLLGLV